jgi:AcrR family transcriptional regulator
MVQRAKPTRRLPGIRLQGKESLPRPVRSKVSPARVAEHLKQQRTVERVAENLFASRGFRGTSMRMVASRAHCSVGQLYNLYADKTGLYRAIWEHKMHELTGLTQSALAEDKPVVERIGSLTRRVLLFFQENTAFFRIYMAETGVRLLSSHRGFVDRMVRHHSELIGNLEELVREGQRQGELRRDLDSRLIAVTMVGMVRGHTMECTGQGKGESLVDRADGILDLYLNGVKNRGGR